MAQPWSAPFVLALAEAVGSARAALSLLTLRLAHPAALEWPALRAASAELSRSTAGAVPPHPLPARLSAAGARAMEELWSLPAPDALALSGAAEALLADRLGHPGRRAAGVYFTPPELAALIVEQALRHGSLTNVSDACPSSLTNVNGTANPSLTSVNDKRQRPLTFVNDTRPVTVLDPCAGAGAFLAAAARALGRRAELRGADLHQDALAAARAQLFLLGHAGARLERADALRAELEPVQLLVSNPPYGKIDDPAERARVARQFPALRGGEIDRYAAFLLRSLQLVVPGGTAALLVPDTWMTNSRGGGIRAAVLEQAEVAAVVDLGKPFAAAKDTRVQAVVLVRRQRPGERPATVSRRGARGLEELAPLERGALGRAVKAGWQPYRTAGERDLCAAMLASSVPLGSACAVGYGLRTGDNGRHVARGQAGPGSVRLLGGEDIVPFALREKPKHLSMTSVSELASLVRRQLGRPRVAIQRIRTNSGKSWARWLEAAVCPADAVCLDSLSTLACDDGELLWALLGLVCSTPVNRFHRLRTTDVNVKPALLATLPLPRTLLEPGGAGQLAALARARAVEAAAEQPRAGGPAPLLERKIDAIVYQLFGLSEELLEVSERSHWGERFAGERPRLDA